MSASHAGAFARALATCVGAQLGAKASARFSLLALLLALSSCGNERASDASSATPSGSTPPAANAGPTSVCDDERVLYLTAPGPRTEAFLRDTSDTLPGLVAQLAYGQVDPLTYGMQQIAALGDEALPELSRFVDAQMRDANGGTRLQNAFGAASLMTVPGAHALLARGLEHPAEAVRTAALRGLVRHPDPADFERLVALMPLTSNDSKALLADAIRASDPARAEDQFADWYEARQHSPIWLSAVRVLAQTTRPASLARIPALLTVASPEDALYLRAALAKNGDAAALASLRETLRGTNVTARTVALQALERAGLVDELVTTANSDPDAGLRAQALSALSTSGTGATGGAVGSALRRALSDGDRGVRQVALAALLARGDAEAQEQALALLKGERPALEDGVHALEEVWKKDEKLARRGLEILLGLRHGEIVPLRVEPRVVDRALAVVPLREAAEELYKHAIEPGDLGPDGKVMGGERLAGISRHHWYTQQIGNTGTAGAQLLREHWKTEADPLRRLDLIAGAIYAQDDTAREFLIAVLDDERTSACEGLYVAERLCRLGPPTRMAPLLKRYALRIDDRRVRPALNSLLWRWFAPQP